MHLNETGLKLRFQNQNQDKFLNLSVNIMLIV